jgi:rhodanese/phosphatase family protein
MASPVCATRRLVLLVSLAITICIATAEPHQASENTKTHSEHSPGPRITLIGVGNFGEVTPKLYRGGQPRPIGFEALAKMGVAIVVDLRLSGRGKERKEVNKLGMQFVEIPWHCLYPKDDIFVRFLTLLRDNPGKKVFVHCRYGDDRTGMMIAAYRMAVEGWTPEEARIEMEKFGFHRLVCPSLVPYEKNFSGQVKKNPAFESVRASTRPEKSN